MPCGLGLLWPFLIISGEAAEERPSFAAQHPVPCRQGASAPLVLWEVLWSSLGLLIDSSFFSLFSYLKGLGEFLSPMEQAALPWPAVPFAPCFPG